MCLGPVERSSRGVDGQAADRPARCTASGPEHRCHLEHVDLAGTLARLERWQEALAEYDAALALAPDHAAARRDRARVLIRLRSTRSGKP